MNYLTIQQNPGQFLALTTLPIEEFDWLLKQFTPHWERYHRYHTLEGGFRQHLLYAERANAKLKGTDTKLFFLLTYLKTTALQQHQAASFGVSQTKVSRLASVLLAVLNQTLAHLGLLPVRNGQELVDRLRSHPQKVFAYDGLERGILRKADADAQADEYSAKKKAIV